MPIVIKRQFFYNLLLGIFACIILVFSFIHESQVQVSKNLGLQKPNVHTVPLNITHKSKVPVHSTYQLPVPGLLPTHPLYVLKMIRDRIILILTHNPDQHAALLLHYADKRIAAAETLGNSGFDTKAIESAIKGETYLFHAINESQRVSTNLAPLWFENLKQAILKHEEVLEELVNHVPDVRKDQINRLHQNLDQYRSLIVSFSGKPFGYPRPEDQEATPSAMPVASPDDVNIPYL